MLNQIMTIILTIVAVSAVMFIMFIPIFILCGIKVNLDRISKWFKDLIK